MTNKTEQQIEKEKLAVAKMIGAKGAMELVLKRVENLERALKMSINLHAETARLVADDAIIRTHYNASGMCCYRDEASVIDASDLLVANKARLAAIM